MRQKNRLPESSSSGFFRDKDYYHARSDQRIRHSLRTRASHRLPRIAMPALASDSAVATAPMPSGSGGGCHHVCPGASFFRGDLVRRRTGCGFYKRLPWFGIIRFRDVHEALVPSSALATDAVTDLDERQLVTAVKRVPIHHLLV